MEIVEFNGWKKNIRLANRQVELVITKDVGPRVIRFGWIGKKNVFAEIRGQQGGTGEKEWMIRGGHRLWIAPENKVRTYELDNHPVEVKAVPDGVRIVQSPGPVTGVQKMLEVRLSRTSNDVTVVHRLRNTRRKSIDLAPWALTVMAPGGKAIIPLPEKIPHTKRLTHNQEWSIWGYTDFTDPRWRIGSKYLFFRQDRKRGPNKLGIAHREGWVAYQLGEFVFVKRFAWKEGARYPDGGVNFETFSNEDFLEMESLGPMVTLGPGGIMQHVEHWSLYAGIPPCRTEEDVDGRIRRRLVQPGGRSV